MNMHLEENQITNNKKKVIFVASYLIDDAADWMQFMLDDYYNNDPDEWDEITKTIFKSYKELQDQTRRSVW